VIELDSNTDAGLALRKLANMSKALASARRAKIALESEDLGYKDMVLRCFSQPTAWLWTCDPARRALGWTSFVQELKNRESGEGETMSEPTEASQITMSALEQLGKNRPGRAWLRENVELWNKQADGYEEQAAQLREMANKAEEIIDAAKVESTPLPREEPADYI